MQSPEEKSRIDNIQKALYSRNAPEIRRKRRHILENKPYDVKDDWQYEQDKPESNIPYDQYEKPGMSFFVKFFIGSLVFFLIALGVGAFLLLKGSNIVSANNVDITVSGPLSVPGGEPFSFDVQVYNKNNIKLELVDMSVEFPAGSANPENPSNEYPKFKAILDDINPGGFSQKTVRALIYGEENIKKEILIRVEYRIKGSNAIFYKEKTYEIIINSAPITLSVSSFKEVNSNQDFELTLNVVSNSKETLKNVLLKAQYPAGFVFVSADVKPVYDNATWKIGEIQAQGKRTIKIRGKLNGQDEEERIFRFSIGTQSSKIDRAIGTEYVSASQSVVIKKPFITADIVLPDKINNDNSVGQFNNSIDVTVTWFNNLDVAVNDAELRVKLSGSAYDKSYVKPNSGLFISTNDEIVWNRQTMSKLASIGPGEGGEVKFTIIPKDKSQPSDAKFIINPDIKIALSVKASRVSENNVPESVASSANKTIRISSNASLSSQALYSTGPFTNTGPIPPKAEKKTTYTVVWTVYNTSSNINGAEVRAILPPYVKWLNNIYPQAEDLTYNATDGSIVWKIGDIDAYTGQGDKKKEVSFQVSLEPSIDQVGTVLDLTREATLTAYDEYTGVNIKSVRNYLSSNLISDPKYKNEEAQVAR